jgi:hypothetical protein
MKLSKPVYDGTKKVYTCDIKDVSDLQYRSEVSGDPSVFEKTPLCFLDETLPASVTAILAQTQGWFSKPLTEDWLIQKLTYSIPTDLVPKGFDGVVEYTPVCLRISKDAFIIEFRLTDTKESEKVCIEFQEDAIEVEAKGQTDETVLQETVGSEVQSKVDDKEGVRLERKKKVLQARERAARALFKAEELIHAYVGEYGMDTDWEDEDEEDS